MRKMFVVALREYNAAVRTKAFLLGLVMMPVLMGGSALVQYLLKDLRDTREKKYAVVDRTPGEELLKTLNRAVDEYNDKGTIDPDTGTVVRPRIVLERENPPADNQSEVDKLRRQLSERVRKGELDGVLEIGPDAARLVPPDDSARAVVRYQSNRLTEQEFAHRVQIILGDAIRKKRIVEAGLSASADKVDQAVRSFEVDSKGLSVLAADGKTVDDADSSRFASLFAPMILMILMFMMVLMTSTPLMQGVVEEKMQRIAEVLLGSVPPFELMMGKILGMTAVSLTIAAVYLGGAYWAAYRYGFSEHAPPGLLAWFLLYQTMASLMFGSLFIAIGAACTDMKETQNLLWPVMLLASMPLWFLAIVLREPNSAFVTAMSFFPFATPMLMIARQAVPPGVPAWQPVAGIAGLLATTLFCVWAAGRIFRVGILMQGKGANFVQMARWIFHG